MFYLSTIDETVYHTDATDASQINTELDITK